MTTQARKEGENMTISERLRIALIEFIERVANGKATSDTEIAALPEVANALIRLIELY